jgi:hypothetical protein
MENKKKANAANETFITKAKTVWAKYDAVRKFAPLSERRIPMGCHVKSPLRPMAESPCMGISPWHPIGCHTYSVHVCVCVCEFALALWADDILLVDAPRTQSCAILSVQGGGGMVVSVDDGCDLISIAPARARLQESNGVWGIMDGETVGSPISIGRRRPGRLSVSRRGQFDER